MYGEAEQGLEVESIQTTDSDEFAGGLRGIDHLTPDAQRLT